jgi:hypothetical protein
VSAHDTFEHAGTGMTMPSREARWRAIRMVGPIIVFLADELISYMLAPVAYHSGRKLPLHLVSLVALTLTVGSTIFSVRRFRADRQRRGTALAEGHEFMSWGGIAAGIFSTLLVIGAEIPNLVLNPHD